MTYPVAKISTANAGSLKLLNPQLDIQVDANCSAIIHEDEAALLLDSSDYAIVEFEPFYIGAPRPKKRK